jgi:hypothetical protein
MDAGHCDDALGRVQGGEIERPPPVEPRDRVAGQAAPAQRVLADTADLKQAKTLLDELT